MKYHIGINDSQAANCDRFLAETIIGLLHLIPARVQTKLFLQLAIRAS